MASSRGGIRSGTNAPADPLVTVRTIDLPGVVGGVQQLFTVIITHGIPSLATFQGLLDKLQEWNYTTVDIDDLYTYLTGTAAQRAALATKPVLLTFDDGNVSQFTTAYPELVSRGMKATFYVVPDWIDGLMTQADGNFADATPFTWANAQTMFANGMRIQSHSMHHTNYSTLTDAAAVADFAAAKARIESQVPGETVSHMAYPNGMATATIPDALIAAGVRTARFVRNQYLVANAGRYEFVSPITKRTAVTVAGTGYLDIQEANIYRRLTRDPEMVPDFAFKGGGKGWTLATGATIDGTTVRPGAPSGAKSLKQVQQTGSVSSKTTTLIPVGTFVSTIAGTIWIKTDQLGAAGRAFVYLQLVKPDGVTVYLTVSNYITTVAATQDWTQYTWTYSGDINVGFITLGLQVTGAGSPVGTAWFSEPSLHKDTADASLFFR